MGYVNGTKSYTSNGLNQYTAAVGATITHDNRGNLTGDGVWTYTYDADNKLKTANKSGYAATLAYDAEGRLRRTTLGGTITDLMYDGVDLVAEYDSAGTLQRRYVHGPGVDEPLVVYEGSGTTNKSWLYADHLGSIVGTANSAGTSTAVYSYGPYGEPSITTGVRFRYTGQQYLGGLNLYYYKARFYSPSLGRFLQTDPIGTADDLNLYAYVGNNPINWADPLGLWTVAVEGYLGIGGGVVVSYSSGTLEIVGRLGVGLGVGAQIEPQGTVSRHAQPTGADYIARTFAGAQAEGGLGPVGVGSGITFRSGNAVTTPVGGDYVEVSTTTYSVTNEVSKPYLGIRVGGAVGVEIGSYSNMGGSPERSLGTSGVPFSKK